MGEVLKICRRLLRDEFFMAQTKRSKILFALSKPEKILNCDYDQKP